MANYSAQYVFGVTADTKAAQTQLQQLSKSLRDIQTKKINLAVDDTRITQAAEAAQLLQHELTKAMNVKTGQLDLSKLSQGLKAANTDVATLGRSLLGAGEQGQQAFSALVGTISAVNAPVKQLNRTITNLGTTLMNTIKWQASSSLVHGLMSTISGAISYARNLNETLNNIQIVTGQNDAQMAKFATTANRMAKELSTTTNEFAKASLIYYQQGDSAELAAKKAAITTKAANVAFTASAQEMSEMLTAVWNSFQMGEDELEHAVDVLAKLGATTASSMEEMATGMQKVAATANTVGVSMEQMSAIVATAASVTRQAPQTIGTAWNTILSRIGGLKLGETLEDGVDLNKYSKALQTIGVNILDANGELREMGGVIDDIGTKWENLTTAQQSALAQTIGGARQYTQILAFFDNFDKYQQNMKTAMNSDGALQEQADIYAESWEAASNRVRASLETLYSQIFDDKAIAKVTSFFGKLIDLVTSLTSSFGGVGNVISLIATHLIQSHIDVFSTKLVEMGNNIKQVFSGKQEINDYAQQLSNLQQQMRDVQDVGLNNNSLSDATQVELRYDIEILDIKKRIAEQQGSLTKAQLETAEATIKNLEQDKAYYLQIIELQKQMTKNVADSQKNNEIEKMARTSAERLGKNYDRMSSSERLNLRQDASKTNIGDYVADLANNATKNIKSKAQTVTITKEFQQAESSLQSLAEKFNVFKSDTESLTLDHVNESAAKLGQELGSADQILKQMSTVTFSVDDGNIENLKSSLTNIVDTMSNMTMFNNFGNADFGNLSELQKAINGLSTTSSQEEIDKLQQKINNFVQEAQAAFEDQFVAKFRAAAEKLGIGPEIDKIIADAKRIPVETEAPIDQAANNIKKIKDEYEKSLSGASNSVQTFVNGAMALQRITTSINAVSNALKTLSDPDVDGMTKFTTVVSTLVTVSMAASSVMNLLKGSTISAAVAAGIKAKQDALATASTVANTTASVAGTAANTGLAASFHAAGVGAKAFIASLGPLGWIIAGLTVVVGLVGGIAAAIAAHEKQIAQQKQDAIDTYNGIIEQQQKLTSSYSSLNSILEDTNLTLSEQLTKINEITKAFGLQVTAADLAGESYDGLNNKLLAYAKSAQLSNVEKTNQATDTLIASEKTYDITARDNFYSSYGELTKWYKLYKAFSQDDRFEVYDNGQIAFSDGGRDRFLTEDNGISAKDKELLDSLGLNDSDKRKLVSELIRWGGFSVDEMSDVNNGFSYNRSRYDIQKEFGLTDAGFDALQQRGLFQEDENKNQLYNAEGEDKYYTLNLDSDLTGEDIQQILNGDLETNVVSAAAVRRIEELEDNAKVQQGIYEVLNSGNINFVGSKEDAVDVSQFRDLINTAVSADTYGTKEQVASYFKDMPVYAEAYAQYTGLGSIAGVVKKSSGNESELSQVEILNGIIDYINANKDIDVDTVLTIRPTAVTVSPDGEITIAESARKLATLEVEATDLTVKADKIEELKGVKSDTLSIEEVQQAKDSGLFTNEDELNQYIVADKNTRAAILERKETDNNAAIHANEVARLKAVEQELAATKADKDKAEQAWKKSEAGYYSPTTGQAVQVSNQTYESMSTDLAIARQRRDIYTSAANLKGVEWGKASESQKATALEAYNLTNGTQLTELTEDQYETVTTDNNIKIYTERASAMQNVIDVLDPLITEYDGLITVEKNLTQEEENLKSSTSAYDVWETKVKNIRDAKTAVSQYQNLIGKNGQLTADELEQLKQLNTALYERYKNGELTNEQFDDAIYEAEIAELEKLKTAYTNASQADEAFITQQKIDALELERKTAQLEEAKNAYSRYSATVKESETKTENMKTGATLLQDNAETGQLTAVQKLQFKQSGLDIDLEKYENAASQTERAAIAAQAWSQYLTQANATLELQNAVYDDVITHTEWHAKRAAEEGSTYLQDKYTSATKLIDEHFSDMSKESKGLIMEALDYIDKNGAKSLTEMTEGEVVQAIYDYCTTMKDENNEAFATIEATGIDTMKSIWDSATAAEAEAARKTISDWESAFKTIASLRQKILSNSVDEITSEEWLQGFLASDYQTAEEYNAALYSKDVSKFELPVLTDDEILAALGITNSWTNGQGKVKNNLTGQQLLDGAKRDNPGSDNTAIREQTAKTIVQALQDNSTGLGLEKYDEGQLKDFVNNWLTQGNSKILAIDGKEINISSLLNKSVEAQKGVRDLNVMQNSKAEATTVRDTAIENAERLSSQAATNLEEMQNYANAAYDLAKDMGEKTVTETMESYTMSNEDFLSKINEVMGQNYKSIEEVPKNVLRDFASAMTESQYAGSESPLAQQVEAARQEMEAQKAYIKQQKNINSNYENTTDYEVDIEKLNELTAAYNEAKAAQDKMIDQDYQSYLESLAEDIDLSAKELEDYGNKMVEQGEIAEGLSRKEQAKYAKALYRQVQGFTTAKKNLKSYTEELKKSKDDVNAHTKALNDMRDMYADVFDLDENQANKLSDTFLESTENAKLLEKAINQDDTAWDKLKANAAQDIVARVIVDDSQLQTECDNILNTIAAYDFEANGIQVGASIDTTPFYDDLNNMVFYSQETADAMSAALSTVGVEGTWEPVTVTVPANKWEQVVTTGSYDYIDNSGVLHSVPVDSFVEGEEGAHTATMWLFQGAKSKYKGGGSPAPSSSSSPGGGGGGGSSKSAKKVESVKRGVDEKDRYHEITEQLERQSKALERLDKIKSRTFGANKLKAIQNEIDALEQENKLYEKQAAEANANANTNRTILQQYGATFNEDGTVNYDEYMDKIIERYNEAVERYNSSEQTAADELMLKEAEEKYEEAKKALEDYEEDLDKLEEAQNNFLENQNKISAAKLEGIQYKVEVKFDLNDRDIKLLQYFRDKWEDLFQMQDESMRYMTEEALKYESNLKTLGTAMDELNAAYGNGTLNQADYATGMQDVNDKMVEQLNNLLTIKKSIKEAYGNTLSKAKEEIEKYTAVLDHSHSVLEQYIAMQQLMGLGADYSGLQKMYQVSYDSSVANVKAAKDYLEVLKNSKEQIEANAAEHGWTDELKQQWADVNAEIQQGEDDLLSYTNQALTDAQNLFSNTMQAIVQDFDEQLFGMKNGLSNLEDDYEYYQEEQARYLSTSKELYEVSKLNRQINDSIADSTTKASKERLKALQEQIKAQSESTRLTEYDVQMMELQYKYALALDDLENAKNAKSTVRLTRDENGNYGYQYTADDDKISESQQKVEDVLQQINELAAERVNEIEQSAVQAEREYRDALLEIASDTTLTLEERQQKMEELTRRYSETMQYNQEQYGNATSALLTNQQYVYDRYGESILENTGMIQDQMNTSVAAMIEKTSSYGTFLQEQLQPGGQIYEALKTYKDNIGIVTNTSGLNSWEDMVASSKDFEEANKAAAAELENINDQLGETLTNISDVTDKWLDHADVLDSVISKYEELTKASADAVRAAAGNMDGESPEATSGAATKEELENIEKQWMYSWSYNGYSGTWSGYDSRKAALKGAKSDIYQKIMSSLEAGKTDEETASNRAKLQDEINAALQTIEVTQYLSGGLIDYTGPAWVDGSLGRPEMILNADDTQKMMNIVDTLHDLDVGVVNDLYHSVVDSAMSYLYALSSLTPGTVNTQSGELQQNVHIEADFPNVTDRNEIVDAFNDLVNMASQYANRR